jgi:hypothetical protein
MHDYITREGIVADLDYLRRVGVSGGIVSYCDTSRSSRPPQPGLPYVPIVSQPWWDLMQFQLKAASDRGLDLWFQASPGYATSGGPWITPELSMQKLVWRTVTRDASESGDLLLPAPDVDPKWNHYRDVAVLAYPVTASNAAIPLHQIVNLTDRLQPTGRIDWKPGPGTWKIARIGHTTTGKTVHPATVTGIGLECDKFSKEAALVQFENYFGKIRAQRPSGSKARVELFYDSWEAENQNWSPGFREAFRQRRGYDPLPWLIMCTGQLVGSETLSRRFDRDWRTTIEELINTEHFAELSRLARASGCTAFRGQPYNGPLNFMTTGALFDVPEGEFWHANPDYGWWSLRMIASVAHVTGKPIASAEALTASPATIRFDVDPFATKAETDLAFAHGINQLAIPHQAHNPWPRVSPGPVAGPYGMLLARGQSWAELAGSWVDYLARCCFLLRQGTFAADIVTLFRPGQRGFSPPAGYAGDLCPEELIISSMTCDNGDLVLPGGMRYRLLELVDTTKPLGVSLSPSGMEPRMAGRALPQSMSLPLLRKVRDLVRAGATVVGPRPVMTPGLEGHPAADAQLTALAVELWGPAGGEGPVERQVGRGRVFSGIGVAQVLARIGMEPDVITSPAGDFPWIHRRHGNDDLYFISNQSNAAVRVTVSFRVQDKVPELWQADTGTVTPVPAWNRKAGRTEVELDFDPCGSVFVRFHPATAPALPVMRARPVVADSVALNEAWTVRFSPAMGAPETVDFPRLVSWTDRPEPGIRHYSGVATYETEIVVPQPMMRPGLRRFLDLGSVKNLARVSVNGTAFPTLWKPPFRCEITPAVTTGTNRITIEVANLWVNRLIGDEQQPADITWNPARRDSIGRFSGGPLASYPEWLIRNTPRPSSNRYTFTTWNYVEKGQPLLPSGLLGPVTLTAEAITPGP